jgi:hypothetical protein
MNITAADGDRIDFWIADMVHYTVTVEGAGEVVAVWYDDLDHPNLSSSGRREAVSRPARML